MRVMLTMSPVFLACLVWTVTDGTGPVLVVTEGEVVEVAGPAVDVATPAHLPGHGGEQTDRADRLVLSSTSSIISQLTRVSGSARWRL